MRSDPSTQASFPFRHASATAQGGDLVSRELAAYLHEIMPDHLFLVPPTEISCYGRIEGCEAGHALRPTRTKSEKTPPRNGHDASLSMNT